MNTYLNITKYKGYVGLGLGSQTTNDIHVWDIATKCIDGWLRRILQWCEGFMDIKEKTITSIWSWGVSGDLSV